MDRLQSALVELDIASKDELEDALARQQLYGGDLLTNLLEVRSFTEAQALKALETAYALPALAPGVLPRASATAFRDIDRQLLLDSPAYPLARSGETLLIALAQPPSQALLDSLSAIGVQPEWRLAVSVRILQALCRDWSLPLERRAYKVIARLEGSEIFHSSRAPNPLAEAPTFSELPRPLSVAPGNFLADWNDADTPTHDAFLAETAPQPAVQPQTQSLGPPERAGHRRLTDGPYHLAPPPLPSHHLLSQRAVSSKPASTNHVSEPSRRGPYSLAQARRDLAGARTAEQVLRISFAYTVQFFDYLAAFTVREGGAYLKRTRGLPSSTPKTEPIALSECPGLARAAHECRHLIAPLSEQSALCERLGLASDRKVAIIPVAVRQRTTILLVGGFDLGQPHSQHLDDASECVPFVSHALERIILKRRSRPPL